MRKSTKEFTIFLSASLVFIYIVSIFTFNSGYQSIIYYPNPNGTSLLGSFGAYIASFAFFLIGKAAYFLSIPLVLLILALVFQKRKWLHQIGWMMLLTAHLAGFYGLFSPEKAIIQGGILGNLSGNVLKALFGTLGTTLILFLATIWFLSKTFPNVSSDFFEKWKSRKRKKQEIDPDFEARATAVSTQSIQDVIKEQEDVNTVENKEQQTETDADVESLIQAYHLDKHDKALDKKKILELAENEKKLDEALKHIEQKLLEKKQQREEAEALEQEKSQEKTEIPTDSIHPVLLEELVEKPEEYMNNSQDIEQEEADLKEEDNSVLNEKPHNEEKIEFKAFSQDAFFKEEPVNEEFYAKGRAAFNAEVKQSDDSAIKRANNFSASVSNKQALSKEINKISEKYWEQSPVDEKMKIEDEHLIKEIKEIDPSYVNEKVSLEATAAPQFEAKTAVELMEKPPTEEELLIEKEIEQRTLEILEEADAFSEEAGQTSLKEENYEAEELELDLRAPLEEEDEYNQELLEQQEALEEELLSYEEDYEEDEFEEKKEELIARPFRSYPNYDFPSINILSEEGLPSAEDKEVIRNTGIRLLGVLREFNIDARLGNIISGPVVTRYEIIPPKGLKVNKIVSLADNISLGIASYDKIRIEAPIPGKSAVGIEVPNKERQVVSLKSLLKNEQFHPDNMAIPFALGKGISGNPHFTDLNKIPHLLIAGSTGSGKSVCVNSLISSILFTKKPDEVKLMLIDPKRVELKLYEDIPHLITPVIKESTEAITALNWAVSHMEERYKTLENANVRNIKSYNIMRKEEGKSILSYLVIIIDEFADLMMMGRKEIEEPIIRLAAMSRAVGIHLVLATQRPSADVITGLIKANFPGRIAFKVSGKVESRIILDINGAENLLGKGDMLYASPNLSTIRRIQAPFISDSEVKEMTNFFKTRYKTDYLDEVLEDAREDVSKEVMDPSEEPLFNEAVEIVVQERKASASYLQRRLKIGYNRAARIVEMMEEMGIVGSANGSKPRDVLIDHW